MHFLLGPRRSAGKARLRAGGVRRLPARPLISLALLMLILNLGLPAALALPAPGRSDGALSEFFLAGPDASNKQFSYVEATGHSIISPVKRYYNLSGGEERHGQPLSELAPDKGHYRQYFERSILEYYPQYNGSGTEVRLAPIGRQAFEATRLNAAPVVPFAGSPDNWYFSETGHSLAGPFLNFWRNNGDTTNLGLPLSEEINQDGPDNQKLALQYFEYARLQRPAGSARPEDVRISSLGAELARQQLKPDQLAAIPRARFNAPRAIRIPSLMFHYARIVDPRKDLLGFALSVTPDNYVKYLDWVKDNGYHTVTVSQINDYLKYGILLPERPVNFRWDDGHDNNWFVYQEMKKRGMTATFYVVSQRLELTPAQWQQIDRDGFEVAAHTRTHPDLLGVKDLAGEITGSKKDLEAILGHPVRSFAYPYGKYNETIKRVARDSGFETAVSTNGGYAWNTETLMEQPVISVTGSDNLNSFAGKIKTAGNLPLAANATAPLKGVLPAALPLKPDSQTAPQPLPTVKK